MVFQSVLKCKSGIASFIASYIFSKLVFRHPSLPYDFLQKRALNVAAMYGNRCKEMLLLVPQIQVTAFLTFLDESGSL